MQDKKKKLQSALAEIVKSHRLRNKKSINLASNEVGISKSIWSDLEKGTKDPQFSTVWRVAESLGVPLSSLVLELEKELKDLSFVE